MKRTLLFMVLMTLPAFAAGEGSHAAREADTSKGGAPGTNVEMPFLMAPVTNADGKLTGYAYVSTRLTASSGAAALMAREKLPFIQDAFVRDVNGQQIAQTGDAGDVDIPALEARLLADARKVMGAGKVRQITVCNVQMAPLKAKGPPARTPQPGAKPDKDRCAG